MCRGAFSYERSNICTDTAEEGTILFFSETGTQRVFTPLILRLPNGIYIYMYLNTGNAIRAGRAPTPAAGTKSAVKFLRNIRLQHPLSLSAIGIPNMVDHPPTFFLHPRRHPRSLTPPTGAQLQVCQTRRF